MSILSILTVIAATLFAILGSYTYKVHKRYTVVVLFFLTCTMLSLYSMAYAFIYTDGDSSGFWTRLSFFGQSTYSALLLHITVRSSDIQAFQNRWLQAALYIPAAVLLTACLQLYRPGGENPALAAGGPLYIPHLCYIFFYTLASLFILIHMKRKFKAHYMRRSLFRWLLGSITIPFTIHMLIEYILPGAGVELLPPISQFFLLAMLIGVYYANSRFGIFHIPINVLYDETLTDMMDLFFILSPDGKIGKINSRTVEYLGYSLRELESKPLENLCVNKKELRLLLDKGGLHGSKPIVAEMHLIAKNGAHRAVRLICSHLNQRGSNQLLAIMVIGQDMTAKEQLEEEIRIQKKYEEKLREGEERFRAMFDQHSAIMCLVDPHTMRFLSVNEATVQFYGYTQEQFLTMRTIDLDRLNLKDAQEFGEKIISNKRKLFQIRHWLADGQMREVEIHSSAVPYGDRFVIFSIIHDITERKKEETYMSRLAHTDSLTGLANRKLFYEQVEDTLAEAQETGSPFAILYIDMDNLKMINDTFGHVNGDMVLQEFAGRLAKVSTGRNVAARLGGDEFAVLLRDIPQGQDARASVEEIGQLLTQPFMMNDMKCPVQASIGIGIFPDDGLETGELLKQADRNMYAMKRGRKKNVQS